MTPVQQLIRAFEAQGSKLEFNQVSVELSLSSMLGWLAWQPHFPKFYWSSRDRQSTLCAVGSWYDAYTLEQADALIQRYPDTELVGGQAFDPSRSGWPDFHPYHYFVPKLLLKRQADVVVAQLQWPKAAEAALRQFLQQLQWDTQIPALVSDCQPLEHLPDQEQWRGWVREALTDPTQEKIVLSRCSNVAFNQTVNPWALLAQLRQQTPDSFVFAYSPNADNAFVGCSPERLYLRDGRTLKSESLAGTMPDIDHHSGDLLLQDRKNRYENWLVREDILQRLQRLCEEIEVSDQLKLVSLNRMHHIKQSLHALLKTGVSDMQLLRSLPPTPAVGGVPRERALQRIAETELYPRGWYAGAVGYLSQQRSELTVAIRSSLVERDHLHLFAGAGLVEGSDPDSEWQELEVKLRSFIQLLYPEMS